MHHGSTLINENEKDQVKIINMYIEFKRNKRKIMWHFLLLALVLAIVIVWAWTGSKFKLIYFFTGLGNIYDFITKDLLPPDFSSFFKLFRPALESFYMAYVGALISICCSLIFGVLAAKNLSFHPLLATICRSIIAFIRAVPGLIIAIFFVGAFGIGPLAGTLAIGFGGIGILGKAYADLMEEIDEGQIEALKAAGASWLQVVGQAVWPQFYAGFVTWSLYKLDLNIRESAILGLVGAGGLGTVLMTSISFFNYKETAMTILFIFAMILSVEYITAKLREKII